MKYNNAKIITIFLSGLFLILATMPGYSATIDSSKLRLTKSDPVQAKIINYGCYKTKQLRYSVTITKMKGAYPGCSPDTVMQRVFLRTVQNGVDVDTYVSLLCCYQQTSWTTES